MKKISVIIASVAALAMLAGCVGGTPAQQAASNAVVLSDVLGVVTVSEPCAAALVAAAGVSGTTLNKALAVATAADGLACTTADQDVLAAVPTVKAAVAPSK